MEIPKSKFKFQFKGCFRCGNKHDRGNRCSTTHAKCLHCGKIGHFQSVCMKKKSKVNEVVATPGYEGQDIYLKDYGSDCDDSSSDEDTNSSHVTIIVGQ